MNPMDEPHLLWKLEQAREIVGRIERISADSCWAHQSSGVRGALLRAIDRLERSMRGKARFTEQDLAALNRLIEEGYAVLIQAAREIPYKEDPRTR